MNYGPSSPLMWTCKFREKKSKKPIFIDIMHDMDVKNDAKNE